MTTIKLKRVIKKPVRHCCIVAYALPVIDDGIPCTYKKQLRMQKIFYYKRLVLFNDILTKYKDLVPILFGIVFKMPVEDQASIYSEETNRSCKLFTSGVHYAHEEAYYCLGFLRHPFHSDLHQNIQQWPTGYRHNIMPDVVRIV
ncbi:hypothetical protein DKX38_008461 [Salix brachista]|uniref:Uncharacterized protein n=1 Tax=Salix brachista TaxID=2182728 RepID=A0A5N5MRE4_9ROSI|nr:hypothetical protein DKX38_008461 [Salix brachista]